MKKLLVVLISLVIFAGGASTALAANEKQDIYLPESETINDNLFRAGNLVDINGDVNGDAVLLGSSITVRGNIKGDLFIIGQSATLEGSVEGSVVIIAQDVSVAGEIKGNLRAVGNSITVNAAVAKNISAAGAFISLEENATIGWGAQLAAANINVNSNINGNLNATGAQITLRKQIMGNATVYADDGGMLVLEKDSVIAKDLVYRGNKDLIKKEGAQILGETIKKPYPPTGARKTNKLLAFASIANLVGLIGALVVGLIIAAFAKNFFYRVFEKLTKNVGQCFGWGALVLFIGPLAIFICLVTIVGIPLGLLAVAIYAISIYLTTIFAGFALGLFILKAFKKGTDYKQLSYIGALLLGIFIYYVITKIPFFGWAIALAGTLWGLGGIFLALKKDKVKNN